jgi:hypothetical protein
MTKARTTPQKQFHYIKSLTKHTVEKASDVCRDLRGRITELQSV